MINLFLIYSCPMLKIIITNLYDLKLYKIDFIDTYLC